LDTSNVSGLSILHAGEGLYTNLSIPHYSPAASSSNILRAIEEDATSASILGTNSLMMIAADDYEAESALEALSVKNILYACYYMRGKERAKTVGMIILYCANFFISLLNIINFLVEQIGFKYI
jgi:hypothetical protein